MPQAGTLRFRHGSRRPLYRMTLDAATLLRRALLVVTC
jgi:hypothetical protein